MRTVGSSSHDGLPNAQGARIGIVVGEWNRSITDRLLEGSRSFLLQHGIQEDDLLVRRVPGSFEIPHAVHRLQEDEKPDAVIALGSLIRGETVHFDVIAHSVAYALQELNIRSATPVLFGVLTDENMDQARARAGGEKGNKGEEAAEAALRMIQ